MDKRLAAIREVMPAREDERIQRAVKSARQNVEEIDKPQATTLDLKEFA